jgi:hypothetical protein
MSTFRKDPLLGIAKVVLTITMAILAIGIAALAIGSVTMLAMKGTVVAKLIESGAPAEAFWAILLLLPFVAVMLILTYRFTQTLRAIVLTVEQGDPFIPDNASRLRTMAWLALAIQLASIPIGALGVWIGNVTKDVGDVEVGSDFSGNGLLLVLVLFILARVFKTGAQMREELEGTV